MRRPMVFEVNVGKTVFLLRFVGEGPRQARVDMGVGHRMTVSGDQDFAKAPVVRARKLLGSMITDSGAMRAEVAYRVSTLAGEFRSVA
eukprot:1636575-Pyramimonas_sp.AAC.1